MMGEPTLLDKHAAILHCLYGEQDVWWDFYETDPDWWELRLWLRRN